MHLSINPNIYLPIYPIISPSLSVKQSILKSIHSSTSPSIYPSIHPFFHPCISTYPMHYSTHPSIQLSSIPYIHLQFYLCINSSNQISIHSTPKPFINLFIHQIHPSNHPFIHPFIHQIHPSIYNSYFHTFIHLSSNHIFIHPTSNLLIHLSIISIHLPSIHQSLFIDSLTHLIINQPIHNVSQLSMHPFMHSFIYLTAHSIVL